MDTITLKGDRVMRQLSRGLDSPGVRPYTISVPLPRGYGYDDGGTEPMRTEKQDALKRLSYIEGHLRGIRKMVEDDVYCIDILKQTHAVKRALEKFDQVLVADHIGHCVPEGIREGRDEQVLGELVELFEVSRR